MAGLAVFPHDVELESVMPLLKAASIRVCTHPEPGAIHLVPYGDSVGVIGDPEELPLAYLSRPLDPKAVVAAVRTAAELMLSRRAVREAKEMLAIARALGMEGDRTNLYRLIVRKLRELTLADSGTLYFREEGNDRDILRFAIAQTGPSDKETFEGGTIEVSNTSLAGAVALTGRPLRFADVYKDASAHGLNFDRSFDEKSGYRTKSMLCIPLPSAGHPVGVLQLINKKPAFDMPLLSSKITETAVEPFNDRDEELAVALSAPAGLALQNVRLLESR